jgi:hypothetical protein
MTVAQSALDSLGARMATVGQATTRIFGCWMIWRSPS